MLLLADTSMGSGLVEGADISDDLSDSQVTDKVAASNLASDMVAREVWSRVEPRRL